MFDFNGIYRNILYIGTPILSDQHDEPPLNFIRFTGRKRHVDTLNACFFQLEIYSSVKPIKITTYVKGTTKEMALCSVNALWALGQLSILTSPSDKEISPDAVLFKDYAQDIYAENGRYHSRAKLKGKKIAQKQLKEYQSIVNDFSLKYGEHLLSEFNDIHLLEKIVKDYIEHGRRGSARNHSSYKGKQLSPKRVKNILNTVSLVFVFAVEDGLINDNPLRKAIMLLPSSSEKTYAIIPTNIENDMFANHHFWTDYLSFSLLLLLDLTGVRVGEALALKNTDIDFLEHRISITKSYVNGNVSSTKTQTSRIVPMSHLLEYVITPLTLKSGYLFSFTGDVPFSRGKIARAFDKVMDGLGLSKQQRQRKMIVLHSFRHSFISHMVAKNISDTNISLITGHDTMKLSIMNMRYTQQLNEAFPAIIAAIDSIFNEETTKAIKATADLLRPDQMTPAKFK